MFVVFEEYRSGGATSVHREACANYARRDAESALGRWFGPFSTYEDARTLAGQLASFSGRSVAYIDCCSASPAGSRAPAFQAPVDTGQVRLKRICLTAMIVSLSMSALAGITVLLVGHFGEFEAKVLGTTLIIGAYSLGGLCGAVWYDRRQYLALAAATIGASGAGMLYALALVWEVIRQSTDVEKVLGVQVTWTVFLAHTSLNMLSYTSDPRVRRIVQATIASAGCVAALLSFIIIDDPRSELLARIIGALAILAVLGTMVAPLARKMTSLKGE